MLLDVASNHDAEKMADVCKRAHEAAWAAMEGMNVAERTVCSTMIFAGLVASASSGIKDKGSRELHLAGAVLVAGRAIAQAGDMTEEAHNGN